MNHFRTAAPFRGGKHSKSINKYRSLSPETWILVVFRVMPRGWGGGGCLVILSVERHGYKISSRASELNA